SAVEESSSEVQLQSKLNDPRVLCRQDLSERGGIAPDVRWIEVRMVESIEELGTKLEVPAFRDHDLLRKSEVGVHISGTAHYSNAGRPKCLRCWSERGESVCIEPA